MSGLDLASIEKERWDRIVKGVQKVAEAALALHNATMGLRLDLLEHRPDPVPVPQPVPYDPAPAPVPDPAPPQIPAGALLHLLNRELTSEHPSLSFPLRECRGYRVRFAGFIPEGVGPGEVYLLGLPRMGNAQAFARTKNGWLCLGSGYPAAWILRTAASLGAVLESGTDGKPANLETERGFVGMRYSRMSPSGGALAFSGEFEVWSPHESEAARYGRGVGGPPYLLQLGERLPPDGAVSPVGVVFREVTVWGLEA